MDTRRNAKHIDTAEHRIADKLAADEKKESKRGKGVGTNLQPGNLG